MTNAVAREPPLKRLPCWQFVPQFGLEKSGEIAAQSQVKSLRFIKLTSLNNYHKNSRLKEKTGRSKQKHTFPSPFFLVLPQEKRRYDKISLLTLGYLPYYLTVVLS
ncbi:hypothetical protein [Serratia sp. MYb239]|uniref:hypothetical protein n=1 Tax=Serratia sp. MYb239 TaxID=2033438 RepID=UPI0018F885CE|nr:hypothetical protein [Serratia sp. MYb239]